ncbi:ribose-5-phosphate isomerase RpiA [Salipaludibacillus aurantiacus]|uniref:Ribose-5-phosphate isomerase A n=1 Tax=Salipaludibacillus aurantiacus TaxID=1601833 RepID=A0A1H9UAP5_9BACI|nr:ribose-5-phosphate isomerase RpiA [Salipaludibacillus aurantiacus]SES06429.1 ribose 5-phosphate isomerase A [Salipaludibacillus aurantiacus]
METEQKKRAAGEYAVNFLEDGMTVGLGSGTTVNWMIKKLAEKVESGLKVSGVPSSLKTEKLAKDLGIPLTDLTQNPVLDVAIDGADQADRHFNLIKGGGGSLLREKIVLDAARKKFIIIDEQKRVDTLNKVPLPVEVVPFGWENTARKLSAFASQVNLRMLNNEPFVSDNGNYILDCQFENFSSPDSLQNQLKSLLGVVETGLFINMTDTLIVGEETGIKIYDGTEPVKIVNY